MENTKNYFSIHEDIFKKLQQLSPKEIRMLIYCIKEREQLYNRVYLQSNLKTLKKLDVLKQHFSTYRKKLIDLGFICPTENKGEYIINPRTCYSKDSDNYIKVVNEWNMFSQQQINPEDLKKAICNKKNSDKLRIIDKCIQTNSFDIDDIRNYMQAFNKQCI